jgi:Uma2 family endonuclease
MKVRTGDTAKSAKAPRHTTQTAARGGPGEEVPAASGGQLVLDGVAWRNYLQLLRALDDRHLRITYDRGALEIMTLSPEHERFKHLLNYLIGVLVEELGWDMAGFGSMTFKRSRQRRGLEPDECYWIRSEPLVRGKDRIDLQHDPPPDLVIEIDITHSSLDRLSIYAVLGVPEVWRFNGQELVAYLLGPDQHYAASQQSRAFPFLDLGEVAGLIGTRSTRSETELVRQFRAWVRRRVAAGWQ